MNLMATDKQEKRQRRCEHISRYDLDIQMIFWTRAAEDTRVRDTQFSRSILKYTNYSHDYCSFEEISVFHYAFYLIQELFFYIATNLEPVMIPHFIPVISGCQSNTIGEACSKKNIIWMRKGDDNA